MTITMIFSVDSIISILFPALFLYIGYHLLFSSRKVRSTGGYLNSSGSSQPQKKLSKVAIQLKNQLFSAILQHRATLTGDSTAISSLTLSIRMVRMCLC